MTPVVATKSSAPYLDVVDIVFTTLRGTPTLIPEMRTFLIFNNAIVMPVILQH